MRVLFLAGDEVGARLLLLRRIRARRTGGEEEREDE
jgi:hypothetical protein